MLMELLDRSTECFRVRDVSTARGTGAAAHHIPVGKQERARQRRRSAAVVLTALVLFTAVAPAHAAPRALTRTSGVLAFAPAGEQVLVARVQGRNLRVFAIPLTGGAGRQVFSFDAPDGLRPQSAALAASAQRAALTIEMGEEPDEVRRRADLRRTGGGRLERAAAVHRGSAAPTRSRRCGSRWTASASSPPSPVATTCASSCATPILTRWRSRPASSSSTATFAGDLVASVRSGGDEDSNMLVVRDWRTGAVVTSADLQDGIDSIALRPDGRAAVTTYEGGLYEVRPGALPRLLARQRRLDGGLRG